MHTHLRVAKYIADLLDNRFRIFGFKVGLDPIIGLIPGIGDVITLLFSFYIIWIAIRMKLPEQQIAQMIRNIIIDFLIGFIPVVGDFGDFVYKANSRNLDILQKYSPIPIFDS